MRDARAIIGRAIETLEKSRDEIERLQAENDRLKSLLYLADEALMLSHGCFPLDRVTADQRYLNDAAKAIRAVTGDDYGERNRLAAIALERSK